MTAAKPLLSVLVVSYETRELTLECLGTLFAQTSNLSFEVIVVDNASSDGSAGAIAEAFPQVQLLALDENLGFGAANNLAAARAQGEFLLLLNPDTEVLDRAVERLVAFAQDQPQAGIWGGRTLFADGSLNPGSCWRAATVWSTLCAALGWVNLFSGVGWINSEGYGSWRRDSAREVDIVSGCFLLLRRALWEELRGFDPAFVMYGEDTDLCARAASLGARPMITPDATIVHHGGASERVRADKMVRLFIAKAQLFRKHWGGLRGRVGVLLLDLWALVRVSALFGLRVISPRRRESYAQWRDVWRRRGEWRGARP